MMIVLIHQLQDVTMSYANYSLKLQRTGQSDALFEFVIGGIRDLKIKTTIARQNIHQARESTPNCSDEGTQQR